MKKILNRACSMFIPDEQIPGRKLIVFRCQISSTNDDANPSLSTVANPQNSISWAFSVYQTSSWSPLFCSPPSLLWHMPMILLLVLGKKTNTNAKTSMTICTPGASIGSRESTWPMPTLSWPWTLSRRATPILSPERVRSSSMMSFFELGLFD